jgi:hypothetical protein
VHRRFENGQVAIRFDPIDILVLTVHPSTRLISH